MQKNYTTLIYRSRRFFWYITCPDKNFLIFRFLQTFFAKNSAKKIFHSKKNYTTLIYRSSRFEWRIAWVSTNFCQFQGIGGRGGPISLIRNLPSSNIYTTPCLLGNIPFNYYLKNIGGYSLSFKLKYENFACTMPLIK